jgi:hypothetical protein
MEKKSLIASMAFAVTLAVASVASAYAISDHSGTICKNMEPGDVSFIDYLTTGTRSFKSSATWVICPLTRNTSDANGADVYVTITHSGTQTTSCHAYSYSFRGNLEASNYSSWTGSGSQTLSLNLEGAGKSDAWSNYVVACLIPGNGSGVVISLDLDEL